MATKTRKRSTQKRSQPKGIKRTVSHNPFPAEAKVGVYHAYDVGPQRDMQLEPLSEPLSTATAKKDGTVEFSVKEPGDYALAAPAEGERWIYQIVSVKK